MYIKTVEKQYIKLLTRTSLWDLLTMRALVNVDFAVNDFNVSLEEIFIGCNMVTNAAHITELFLNKLRKLFHILRRSSTRVGKFSH